VADAFRVGMSRDDVFALSKIDPWFLAQIEDIVGEEKPWPAARWKNWALTNCVA
jgi:hypothetical protein